MGLWTKTQVMENGRLLTFDEMRDRVVEFTGGLWNLAPYAPLDCLRVLRQGGPN